MNVNTYNQQGEKTGTIELTDSLFGLQWNPALVWQVAESERSNRRKGTAHAKDRSEVRGGGKKPWRQKGTGRARHGSIRSPIWIGGGVTHGPRKEKVYTKKINKKMKQKATATLLSQKMRDNDILFLDSFSVGSAKTKEAARVLKNLASVKGFEGLEKKTHTLVLLPSHDTMTMRALRNIEGMRVMEARNMSILDMLGSRYILLPKESIDIVEKNNVIKH